MTKGFFITGTDTDVGKTVVALTLMHALQGQGFTVNAFKPVSAGCRPTPEGLVNDDALLLQQASSIKFPYDIINPYAFEPPIAPHIAALQSGKKIEIETVCENYQQVASKSDYVIVEGAGGWMVPVNENETMADMVLSLSVPVIVVVGIRLGCLNHALLTVSALENSGNKLVGWVANHINPATDCAGENIDSLRTRITAPLLGTLPYRESPNPQTLAQHLDLSPLL